GLVDEVGGARGDDHHDTHHEDPYQQLDLHGGTGNGEQDEGDEGYAGDAVSLEAVRRRSDRVPGVAGGAIRDHAGGARVLLLDLEDDLHEVGADVGDLGEYPPRDAQRRGAQRLPDGESDEAGARVIAGNEQEDEQHDHQLDADEQHADGHPRLEWNGVAGV